MKRAVINLLISVLILIYLVGAVGIKWDNSSPIHACNISLNQTSEIANETNETSNLTPKKEIQKTEVALQATEIFRIYDIYLSPNGNDNNNGTINYPIKTLNKAKEMIRNLQPLGQNVNVYLRGCTYYLDKPFVLDSEKDSGGNFSITYQSYPGEKAVISGGYSLKPSWQLFNSNIYVTDVSSIVDRYGFFNSLFIDGKRATKSRIPNTGYYAITNFDKDNSSAFYFKTGEINSSWKNLNDIEIVASRNWIQSRFKISKIEGNKVYLSGKSNPYYFSWGQDRYYLENVFEGLSAGEYYLDKQTKKLYYWSKAGEKIGSLQFTVPVTKTLVRAGNYSELKEKLSQDYLEIHDLSSRDSSLNLNQNFSLSMWVKIDNKTSGGHWIISKGDPWNWRGFGIYVQNSELKLAVRGDGSRILPTNSCSLTTGQWNHCTITINKNSGVAKLYKNGAYVSEAKIATTGDTSTTEPLIIGKLNADGFTGAIDELKIYNRVLTANEIKNLSVSSSIKSDKLAVSLSFEDNLDDEKGSLPLTYGNPQFVPGKTGKAISFKKRYPNESFSKYLDKVNFKNLVFSYTDWKIPNKGYAGFQVTIKANSQFFS